MREVEFGQILTRAWLESWIERNEKPDWLGWFGLYPAQASVKAAHDLLNAMNEYGLLIDVKDSLEVLSA